MLNIFSFLPIAFLSTSLQIKNMKLPTMINLQHERLTVNAMSDSNEKHNIDYKLYASRRIQQLKNKCSPKTLIQCSYCHGTGFIKCPKCNSGCWYCQRATLVKCHYCGGGGEGIPSFNFVPIQIIETDTINEV